MNSMLTSDTPPRELCGRAGDDIEAALLWAPGIQQLRVDVLDLRPNQAFDAPAGGRAAMQVFHPPHLYAAACGPLGDDPETEPALAELAEREAEEPAS